MSISAHDILEQSISEMVDRASQRDSPQGERSMKKTVNAFNALTGYSITEGEGWLFMEVLKLARSMQGSFRLDDFVDAAAYAGLRGECEYELFEAKKPSGLQGGQESMYNRLSSHDTKRHSD